MKLQINTLAGSILFESEAESLRDLVIGAVKEKANLSGANLSGADLSWADLRGANLSGANGLKNFDALEWFRKSFKKTKRGVIG